MPNPYTSSNITATVPAIGDVANVTVAFEQYHASIADDISSKQTVITGAATSVLSANLTANSVLVANATGKISSSSTITTSELGVLDGLTSQSQIYFQPGMIAPYMGFTVPSGWLFCNGATVAKSSYPNLANVIAPNIEIGRISYNSDGDTDNAIIDFVVSLTYELGISLVTNQTYSVSLIANSAIRTETRLAEVSGFPASDTLFGLVAVSPTILRWYSDLDATFTGEWINEEGLDGYRKYLSSQLGFTLNIYGNPSLTTNMKLPDFTNKFIYGSNVISNVSSSGGSQSHSHSVSGYARIDFSGSNVFVQETTVGSWAATERFTTSGSSANTSSRTIGVNVIGGTSTVSHMPPYATAKYIIKT
jgi:microcystin-dependent protein